MTGLILYSNFQDFRDLSSGRRLKAEIAKTSKFAFSGVGLLENTLRKIKRKIRGTLHGTFLPLLT